MLGMLTLVVSTPEALHAAGETRHRWSLEAAAGVQSGNSGSVQSFAAGFAPSRSLTVLLSAERSRIEEDIDYYPDGSSGDRGGVIEFVSAEVRYAVFAQKRVAPYALLGTGRGLERPTISAYFPYGENRRIVVVYYGAGARVPLGRRVDVFADWRLIVTGDDAAEMAVIGPIRFGVALRF